MNKKYVGDGKVVLIASPNRVYTDIAARFVRSERDIEDIIATDYSKDLVRRIIDSGHEASTEFDNYIFGISGYSRVTEVQLVRKRLASYMIKSGRCDMDGNRSFDVVIPKRLAKQDFTIDHTLSGNVNPNIAHTVKLNYTDILDILEEWYEEGINQDIPEEDLRYMKPQATEFKAMIGMNAHSLRDWFRIRCCKNAQGEIRDLANKMLKLCKEDSPDLFSDAGANCKRMGYCPENKMQNEDCKDNIITKDKALEVLKSLQELKALGFSFDIEKLEEMGNTIVQNRKYDFEDVVDNSIKETELDLGCDECLNKKSELYPICDMVNEDGDCDNFKEDLNDN